MKKKEITLLDIDTLIYFRKFLNLKYICNNSGVNYGTINKKIFRHLKNPKSSHLTTSESQNLLWGLKQLNIHLLT